MTQATTGTLDANVLRPSGAILAANIAIGAVLDADAVADAGHDPTILDLLVRIDLAPGQALRAVELCRQLRLSPSHISRSIDKAAASGLVERRPDPADRRAKVVSLLPVGREVVAGFAPKLEAVLRDVIFETLSSGEVDTLVELLGRVEAAAVRRLEDS